MSLRLSNLVLLACILAATTFLVGLGVWQLQRLEWKEALIARVQQGLSAPPATLGEIETAQRAGEDIEYRPVKLSGRYRHAGEAHYFATHKSRPGYFVYTPMELADGRLILVNRGYVPMNRKNRQTRVEGLPEGEVQITGLARSAPAQKPNGLVPNNDLEDNIFYWKSLTEMAFNPRSTIEKGEDDLLTFFVDVREPEHTGRWPEAGVTRIAFPNSHLQYAFTWFGLSAALMGVGGYFLFTRMRQPASTSD